MANLKYYLKLLSGCKQAPTLRTIRDWSEVDPDLNVEEKKIVAKEYSILSQNIKDIAIANVAYNTEPNELMEQKYIIIKAISTCKSEKELENYIIQLALVYSQTQSVKLERKVLTEEDFSRLTDLEQEEHISLQNRLVKQA